MKRWRLLVSLALSLGCIVALLWPLRSSPSVMAALPDDVPASLARPHDPVVMAGSTLIELADQPLDEIFVYAYRDAALAQIPSQIDERDANGVYVPVEDDQLDGNDELVFMASDAGGWIDLPWLNVGGRYIMPTYVITLTDPLDGGQAWAYLFCSAALSRTATSDYVLYDAGTERISAPERYTIGFDATYGFPDFLTLGSGDEDLLDRTKLRISGTVYDVPFAIDEEDITVNSVHVLDGPVRVTRVSSLTLTALGGSVEALTNLHAYRSQIVQPAAFAVPPAPAQTTYLRSSLDWNEQASGMVYYDANNPAGATVDGVPDAIAVSPPTSWTQVGDATGAIVNVSAIPPAVGGTPSTYYADDSVLDASDTGDQRSYGDAGFQVSDPNPGIYAMLGQIYVLTGTTSNVGAIHQGYAFQPLQVSLEVMPPVEYIYLPILFGN